MTDSQTSDRDVSRAIRSWLHEDWHEDASRIAGAVLDQVEATPERRAGWPAWRTPTMNRIVTLGLGAAAVVVAVFVGAQLLGTPSGGFGSQPTPSPTPTATPEPAATPEPSPSVAAGLPEGPHLLWDQTDDGPVAVTVTIAAPDWDGDPGGGILEWKEGGAGPADSAGMITFEGREYYVYGDPCDWSSTIPDTPATTVDELVGALANQASREASAPEDITVDGYAGKKIVLHMADDVDFDACDEGFFALFGQSTGTSPHELSRYSQGPGQIEEVWAVDVDGLIVVMDGVYYADTPQNAVDELRAILASATFELP
jgi:hypothetical protein